MSASVATVDASMLIADDDSSVVSLAFGSLQLEVDVVVDRVCVETVGGTRQGVRLRLPPWTAHSNSVQYLGEANTPHRNCVLVEAPVF